MLIIVGGLFMFFSVTSMRQAIAEEKHGHDHEEKNEKVSKKESHDERGPGEEEQGHEEGEEYEEGVMELNQEAQEMIQLKVTPVKKTMVENRLKVFGKIAKDTDEHSYVTADDGIIEAIHAELGANVEKGDKLLTLRKTDGTPQDILADISGVILATYVKTGEHADRLKSLMSIVNLDKLRATVDVYEKDIGSVKIGQKAELQSIAFPDKIFMGEVVYISPQVEEESQAIKVRIDVDNSEHLLRLGMFISGDLVYESEKEAIAVPVSAIQELNEESIVFVVNGDNKFALTEVALGQRFGDHVEIKQGLEEGQKVVTQGSFYLKSEQAKASFGHGHSH